VHEKTDNRDFESGHHIDMVVADVSFISLREILPAVGRLVGRDAELVMMVKPQFEARQSGVKHKGVIKNDKMRREILKDFEAWVQQYFKIVQKADSTVPGSKGNVERFYLLKKLSLPH
jgi:23S rRNA (cytidine1920-2'-O)/16S rRNA (cytidine1409-2'-O)-methyltransferase